NHAGNEGGGIHNDVSSPKIINVTIRKNSAGIAGGGLLNTLTSAPELTNVLINGNTAGNYGGGLFHLSSGIAMLTNVTAVDNMPDAVNMGLGSVTLNNTIIYGGIAGTYTAWYSLIEGSSNTANGNLDATDITATSVFVSPADGD